ncbi:TetR/AcrR family transcriptional regulator [Microtetraspora sp. NBRC 16547]|uniref:TetR/AcrR family transcriptional regulator n=1 Tax=Microtetraspora sp. NBRC 16547 TaxID=3030993 RepID=UPI0024A3F904|nr:TetR/AcrR family transcriptional regulator [Microtetraspora sp. NBRC 16547]GLX02673.1 TetR family transcriptional regulator [Microtetraspora sp. NBRC 16547]
MAQPAEARTASQRARRERILAMAVEMLDEREYEQIQIREVAEASEVALATLYRYFPSKEQLYAHALIEWGKPFESKVLAQSLRATTDADRLRAVLKRTARAYARHPYFYKLITVLEVTTDVAAREVFAGYARSFTNIVQGLLHDTDPRDVALVALVAQSVLGQQLREWSLGRLTLRTVLDNLDAAVTILFGKPRVRGPQNGEAGP